MFVTEDLDAVTVGADTVWVRTRLDFGRQSAFMDELRAVVGSSADLFAHLGSLNLALMAHLVARWEGPAFRDAQGNTIPCTPEMIRRLDPEDPLVEATLRAVNRYNPLTRSGPAPKSATSAGAPPSTG